MKVISAVCFFVGLASAYGNPPATQPCVNLTGLWSSDKRDSNISVIQYEEFPTVFRGIFTESWMGEVKGKLTGIVSPVEGAGSLIAVNTILPYEDSVTAWVGQCMVCDGEERIFTTWIERSKCFDEKWVQTRVNREIYRKVSSQPAHQLHEASNNGEPLTDADLRGGWSSGRGDSLNITVVTPYDTISGYHLTSAENPIPIYGVIDTNSTFIVLSFASAGPTSIKGWTGHVYYPRHYDNMIETSWLDHTFTNSCTNPRAGVKFGQDNYSHLYSDTS